MPATQAPYSQYFDKNGDALDAGYVWFGVATLNPKINPIQVYWDSDMTQPAPQPLRTLAGYIARNGSPAQVFTEVNYSQTVENKKGELVYYAGNSNDYSGIPLSVGVVTGVDGQTVVNLPFNYTRGNNSLAIYQNGLLLLKDRDYTETSTTSITLVRPLRVGPSGADEITAVGGRLINPANALGMVSDIGLAAGSGFGLVGMNPTLVPIPGTLSARLSSTVDITDAPWLASPTATPAFNAAAINACFAHAVANGKGVTAPPGNFPIDSTCTLDLTGTTVLSVDHVSFKGAGRGLTKFTYTGPISTPAFEFKGPVWGGFGSIAKQVISGFTVDGVNPVSGRTGIKIDKAINLVWFDVEVIQCGLGIDTIDIVSWSLTDCAVSYNNYGWWNRRSPAWFTATPGSPNNIIKVDACEFVGNRQWACDFWDSSNIVFIGGDFQSNCLDPGTYALDAETWCVRIRGAGYNGAAGLMMYGTHFETNGGGTTGGGTPNNNPEVWIDHDLFACYYGFFGCDFVRNGPTSYPKNNIYFATTNVARATLQVSSGFRGVNAYVESAARPYVGFSGSINKVTFDDRGSMYESDTARPAFNSDQHRRESHVHYMGVQTDVGVGALTTGRVFNQFTATRNATAGNYSVVFIYPHLSNDYRVDGYSLDQTTAPATQQLTCRVVSQTTAGFTVQFRNLAGVATSPSGKFILEVGG